MMKNVNSLVNFMMRLILNFMPLIHLIKLIQEIVQSLFKSLIVLLRKSFAMNIV